MPLVGTTALAARFNSGYHLKHLDRVMGRNAHLAQFLNSVSLSTHHKMDDFDQATMDGNIWTTSSTGAGNTIFAQRVNDINGTMVRGATGATNANAVGLRGARLWTPDANCMMEVRFKVDVVTNLDIEIGWVDILTDFGLPGITAVDTPTKGNGSGDIAIVKMNTAATLTTMAFVTGGTNTSGTTVKTNLGTRSPTAAAWMIVRVGVLGRGADRSAAAGDASAFCQVFDGSVTAGLNPVLLEEAYHGDTSARSIEATSVLLPYVLFTTRSGTAKTADLDYIFCIEDR